MGDSFFHRLLVCVMPEEGDRKDVLLLFYRLNCNAFSSFW